MSRPCYSCNHASRFRHLYHQCKTCLINHSLRKFASYQVSTCPAALTSRDKSCPDSSSGASCSFITQTSTRKTILFLPLMFHYQQFKVRSSILCTSSLSTSHAIAIILPFFFVIFCHFLVILAIFIKIVALIN